jgi:nucleoside-diphosphate-sugar epimerase
MARVVIVGGAGLIGSRLSKALMLALLEPSESLRKDGLARRMPSAYTSIARPACGEA